MSQNASTFSSVLVFFIITSVLYKPVHAFGAGNILESSDLKDLVWKHGDSEDVLAFVAASFATKLGFTKLDMRRVYFESCLRYYSLLIEIMSPSEIKELTLRVIVRSEFFCGTQADTEEGITI